ncbi:MAG: aldehyde ferredoxin oxidoreductase C-terminal domain-containing protein [Eubacteriales bacterium]
MQEHVQNYLDLFYGITGKTITTEDMIVQSEKIYNFQRVFNIRMGKGLRKHDKSPYRMMGPVTKEEYESRQERYDTQLKEKVGYNPEGKTTEEKIKALREFKYDQYEQLADAVYKRRGWTMNGVPTKEKLQDLGMDFPEVLEVIEKHL